MNFSAEQPIFTPLLETEFPELGMQNVPCYTEMNDGSLPATPMYPNMMGAIQEQGTYAPNSLANTQFDWDTNESITSSKHSPNQSRSRLIQFTQNMTPQDLQRKDREN